MELMTKSWPAEWTMQISYDFVIEWLQKSEQAHKCAVLCKVHWMLERQCILLFYDVKFDFLNWRCVNENDRFPTAKNRLVNSLIIKPDCQT